MTRNKPGYKPRPRRTCAITCLLMGTEEPKILIFYRNIPPTYASRDAFCRRFDPQATPGLHLTGKTHGTVGIFDLAKYKREAKIEEVERFTETFAAHPLLLHAVFGAD